jgi:hypothetical protein
MRCTKRVGRGVITYPCIIGIPSGLTEHEGPCAAIELPNTQATRQRWEEGEKARTTLAQVQSQPQTFAERNPGHAPSPVPGSTLQPDAYRQEYQPKVGQFGEQPVSPQCPHPLMSLSFDQNGTASCKDCGASIPMGHQPAHQDHAAGTLHGFVNDPTKHVAQHTLGAHQIVANPSCPLCTQESAYIAMGFQPSGQTEPPTPEVGLMPGEHQPPDPNQPGVGGQRTVRMPEPNYPSDPEFSPEPSVPTKQRPGDQRLPNPDNSRIAVHEAMAGDIMDRLRIGIERYGAPLRPMNGRDTIQDAYEEVLDLGVYLRTLEEERREALLLSEDLYARLTEFAIHHPEALSIDMLDASLGRVVMWLRGEPQT